MEPVPEQPADPQPDWAHLLPREAFYEIILILRAALPPPEVDLPVDWARRDSAAMAAVASLRPANAAEGRLAAQFVAADAYAMECLRLAQIRRRETDVARRCAAQAASLMRESKSALRLLLRLQAVRGAIEADAATADRAAWTEHSVLRMMEPALAPVPAAPAAPKNLWKFRPVSDLAIISVKTRLETPPRLPPGLPSTGAARSAGNHRSGGQRRGLEQLLDRVPDESGLLHRLPADLHVRLRNGPAA